MGVALSFFKQDDPVLVELHGDAFEVIISHMTVSDIFKNATSVSKLWRERAKSNTIWLPRYIAGLEADRGFQWVVAETTGVHEAPRLVAGNETIVKWRYNRRDRRALEDYAKGELFELFMELWKSMYHAWFSRDAHVLDCKSYKEKYAWITIDGTDITLRGTANIFIWVTFVQSTRKTSFALVDGVVYGGMASHMSPTVAGGIIEVYLLVFADGSIALNHSTSVYVPTTNAILFAESNRGYMDNVYLLRTPGIADLMNEFTWLHSTDANNLIQCQLCSDAPAAYVDTRRLAAVCEPCSTLK
jgi:hypothetical protein